MLIFSILEGYKASSDDTVKYLAHLGIKQIPNGILYMFKNMYKVKVDLEFDLEPTPVPKLLDCEKCNLKIKESKRSKRSIDTKLLESNDRCLYVADYDKTKEQSQKEDIIWQQILNNTKPVYFELSYADSCILKRLVLKNLEVTWRKRYDEPSNRTEIVSDYVVYYPWRNITEFKKITFRRIKI